MTEEMEDILYDLNDGMFEGLEAHLRQHQWGSALAVVSDIEDRLFNLRVEIQRRAAV